MNGRETVPPPSEAGDEAEWRKDAAQAGAAPEPEGGEAAISSGTVQGRVARNAAGPDTPGAEQSSPGAEADAAAAGRNGP